LNKKWQRGETVKTRGSESSETCVGSDTVVVKGGLLPNATGRYTCFPLRSCRAEDVDGLTIMSCSHPYLTVTA
jgi:hypothetical protein